MSLIRDFGNFLKVFEGSLVSLQQAACSQGLNDRLLFNNRN